MLLPRNVQRVEVDPTLANAINMAATRHLPSESEDLYF
jgi:hypothetical protein